MTDFDSKSLNYRTKSAVSGVMAGGGSGFATAVLRPSRHAWGVAIWVVGLVAVPAFAQSVEPVAAPPVVAPVPVEQAPVPNAPVVEADEGIVVTSSPPPPTSDPISVVNKVSFGATMALDDAVMGPVAKVYEHGLPEPLRDGLHNALTNLREPMVFANFLLQHKIGKAAQSLARFAINSTVGVLGLFDFARRKPFKLRQRSNGFANTLGFYGVGPGAFIYVPLFGPTTVRDMLGRLVDRAAVPLVLGATLIPAAYAVPVVVVSILDRRVQNDERIKRLRAQPDPYKAMREDYMRRRRAEIEELRHPTEAEPEEPALAP
jgi:phospholipid-binding lipoprotein MlaA